MDGQANGLRLGIGAVQKRKAAIDKLARQSDRRFFVGELHDGGDAEFVQAPNIA
jgi:hypothetical protein